MVNQLALEMDIWGLEKDYFMAAVSDSASNMNSFWSNIEGRRAKYLRDHYCVDHVFKLTVIVAFSGNASLDNDHEDTSVGYLKKARNLLSHIYSSSNAMLAKC